MLLAIGIAIPPATAACDPTPTRTTWPEPASQASSWRFPAVVVGNSSAPSRPPVPSSAAATFRSGWVSTPR